MPLFPLPTPPNSEGFFELKKEDLHHLTRVMRLKAGEIFQVLLPDGKRGEAEWLAESLQGKIVRITGEASPLLPLWIGIGMVRWPRMEWLAEKLAELGVARVTPLLLTRGRFKGDEISKNKMERLKKISQESIKQCGRAQPPQWDAPMKINDWLKSLEKEPGSINKILFELKSNIPLFGTDEKLKSFSKHLFLIGPEGGCTTEEIDLAIQHGFQIYSLGNTVLRTETAAMYSTSLLNFLLSTAKEIP